MTKKDYYKILGVDRGASADEIKRAFRRLASKHHPDKHNNSKVAEERFKEINEAYSTLRDPLKRRMFDELNPVFQNQTKPSTSPSKSTFAPGPAKEKTSAEYGTSSKKVHAEKTDEDPIGEVISDLFGDFFDSSKKPKDKRPKGRDLRFNLSIDLEGTVVGMDKKINFMKNLSGKEVPTHLTVAIPRGVKNGQKLRIQGEGDVTVEGGRPGDLYVVVSVRNHPLFTHNGDDISLDLPVTFSQAALGQDIIVPSLTGSLQFNLPQGTASGQIFRLKDQGLLKKEGPGRGDMFIKVLIDCPQNLNLNQREQLKKLAELNLNYPLLREFEARVRDLKKGSQ